MIGFIKLHRSLLNWEWYSDDNCFRLFMHCLLKANYKDGRFLGKLIKRGQFATSYKALAKELNLTIRQIRYAFSKLKLSGELSTSQQGNYLLVTVTNYDKYQDDEKQIVSEIVNPLVNELSTDCHQIVNNIRKEEDNKIRIEDICINSSTPENENFEKPKYRFEGKVIKVNEEHFANWENEFPYLNIFSELTRRDDWLSKQPQEIQDKWFMPTVVYLGNRNTARKQEMDKGQGEYPL